MSDRYFSSLPEELQTVLLEEGTKAGDEMTRLTLAKQDEYLQRFKDAGVTIVSDVDKEAFQAKTASVYDSFPDWSPGLHDKVMSILNA